MATYVVGDVQGCYQTFKKLITKFQFDPQNDHIVFAGDLIARGPDSLAVTQWVLEHKDSCSAVLGNHDLNFLAVTCGLREPKSEDRIQPLLESSISGPLVDWYRQCPLAMDLAKYGVLVVHAGVWPGFDRETLMSELDLVHQVLLSSTWVNSLASMYGNTPAHYNDAVINDDRVRFLINACTRMRFIDTSSLALDFNCKESPDMAPPHLTAWMDIAQRVAIDRTIVFGHWAKLNGSRHNEQCIALDTGCVWGGHLTALRLEDRRRIQVPASG